MPAAKVFKASAGSGKTFTLAVQYIRLLITGDVQEYMHTLAVTFTNKATAEMKDRILEQLYGIGHEVPDSDNYLDALQKDLKENGIEMSNTEVRNKCRVVLHQILHDYSRFRVETIDSFFQAVLRNLARELGLNARLQIDLNDKQILSQAVDNMVDGLGKTRQANATTRSSVTPQNSTDIMPWIDEYVKAQIENDEAWDIRTKIKELASIIFKEAYMNRDETFRERINDEAQLKAYRKSLYALKTAAEKQMAEIVNELDHAIKNYDGDLTQDVSKGAWISDFRDKLMRGEYHFKKSPVTDIRHAALNHIPDLVKKKDADNVALHAKLQPVCQAILEAEANRIEFVKLTNTVDLSLKHINPLRLLDHVEKEVTDITNDSNRFILAKTPILLASLIKDSDAPFVFERMGTTFQNVMIDEFQDTSKLQWENFKVLLLESQSTGGSSLLVGDVKQSIYRFRNGDWHILHNIEKELTAKPVIKTLKKNFRSDVNIIRFNNALFKSAAEKLDEKTEGTLIRKLYEDVQQLWPAGKPLQGYARVMLLTGKSQKDKDKEGDADDPETDWEETMLEDVCKHIKQLHDNGLSYNDMCILLRSRTPMPRLIEYVHSHLEDVRLVSDEGFKLSSSKILGIIIAALKVLCYAGNDPVSERFLIKQYMQMTQKDVTIEQYATAKAEEVLPEAFTTRMAELKEYPLNELCEELYRILGLHQIDNEDAYVLSFYDELANYLRNGTSDILSFLEYWENEMQHKDIPACQVEGINIVTIHKSKGLQYHTVLMPYCDNAMDNVRNTELIWCDSEMEPYNTMGALPINGSSKTFEESYYSEDYYEEQLQRRIEELNALYVAFTRAEHNLYVWGKATKKANFADLLKENLTKSFEDKLRNCLTPNNDGADGEEEKKEIEELLKTPIDEYTKETEEPITIWTYGKPYTISKKTDNQEEAAEKETAPQEEGELKNRLAPHFQRRDIHFKSYNRTMDFRQSNQAAQYIRQQGDDFEAEKDFTADGLTFIEQGKLLHEVFSSIEHIGQIDKALKTYLDRGILSNEQQVKRIRTLINRGLEQPEVQEWFNGSYQVMNECEIVHLDPETGKPKTHRPDRVMLSDKEVVVVDFKFGRPHPEDYEPQVQNYMQLMTEMYPDRKITGYLWYVYRNQIEEVTLPEKQ